MENTLFQSMEQFDFAPVNQRLCVGTWKNYAVTLQQYSGRNYFVFVAVRVESARSALRKSLRAALKEAGIKHCSVNQVMKNHIQATVTVGKDDSAHSDLCGFLDALTGILRQNGIGPANTCAITGAPNPDSLCLMQNGGCYGFQPVFASAVRQSDYETKAQTEENELNGSYLTGLLGAVLGMVAGMAVNLLLMVLAHKISVWLFALIPFCAMFGYKRMKGKTNWVAMLIVIVLSLIAVPLMEYIYLAISVAKEYDASLSEALKEVGRVFFQSKVLKETTPEMLKMLLFMALGVAVSWGYMRGNLNTAKAEGAKTQMETLRKNPNV